MRSAWCTWLCVSAVVAAGCTTGGDGTTGALTSRAGSVGIVQLERELDPEPELALPTLDPEPQLARPSPPSPPRAVIGAAFAQYRGMPGDAVVRFLGGRVTSGADACTIAQDGALDVATPDAEVELLDAGALDVRVGDSEAKLLPRTFPELGTFAAGVFYAGDATLSFAQPDQDVYVFHAEGGVDVPGFEVAVPAPAHMSGVRIDGVAIDSGAAIIRGRDAEIAWDGNDPRDLVEIEIGAGEAVLSCMTRDDGTFRLSGASLAQLTADRDATFVVRRVRVQPFDAPSMDAAYASVAATRDYVIVVR